MDEQALSELLECSVCLERLDHTSRVLPCQHTFCRRCLEEILSTQQELRCPECRTLVTIRVEDLPPNILLVRLLEGLKTQSQVLGSRPALSPGRKEAPGDAKGSAKPGWDGRQPCARALYSYEASEKGDLTLKKGDMVTLRRQVDDNWYQGELNGEIGVFPASYVQVLVPLPQIPQCRALYDFQLDDEIEKDCLTFKKDQVITVIRKVDTNWIEGRKGDKIGILPLAFVELNHAAKTLISSKPPALMLHHGSRSSTATTTTTTASTPLTTTTTTTTTASATSSVFSVGLSPGKAVPSTSSSRVSPHHKRHSFTPKSDSPSPPPQAQRHSLELCSSSSSSSATTVTTTAATTAATALLLSSSLLASSTVSSSVSTTSSGVAVAMSTSVPAAVCSSQDSTGAASAQPLSASLGSDASKEPAVGKGGNGAASSGTASVYMAMYSYRPQKEDEVELRRGDYYSVTDKCQDGWFKGQCLRTGLQGVFPGNYVQAVRQSRALKSAHSNILNIRAKSNTPSSSPNHRYPHQQQQQPPPPPPPPQLPGLARSLSDVGGNSSSSSPPIPPHVKTGPPAPPLLPRVARMAVTPISTSGGRSSSPGQGHGVKSISNTHVPITITGGRSNRGGGGFETPLSTLDPGPGGSKLSAPSSSKLSAPSSSKLSLLSSASLSSDSNHHHPHHHHHHHPHQHRGSSASTSSQSALMAVHQSMSTSCNITPPNVVMGPSESSSSPLMAPAHKDKRERREKEKKGLVKLWPGKSKKKSTPESTPVPTASADAVAHTRSGSFPSERSSSAGPARESSQHRKTASLDSSTSPLPRVRCKQQVRERYRCIVPYPPQTDHELALEAGDIVHVHKRREDGWYKGTQERTARTGLFPGSFVEKCN